MYISAPFFSLKRKKKKNSRIIIMKSIYGLYFLTWLRVLISLFVWNFGIVAAGFCTRFNRLIDGRTDENCPSFLFFKRKRKKSRYRKTPPTSSSPHLDTLPSRMREYSISEKQGVAQIAASRSLPFAYKERWKGRRREREKNSLTTITKPVV